MSAHLRSKNDDQVLLGADLLAERDPGLARHAVGDLRTCKLIELGIVAS